MESLRRKQGLTLLESVKIKEVTDLKVIFELKAIIKGCSYEI